MRVRIKLLLLGALLMALSGVGAAQSTVGGLPTIETVGVGSVTVEANQLIVTIRIETEGETAAATQQQHVEIIDAIREALQATNLGVTKFVAHGINLHQTRMTLRQVDGFRTTSSIEVWLGDAQQLGRVIDLATAHGATAIQGVKYHSDRLEEAAQEALHLAVLNAMRKAETVSRATGTRIVMIKRVSDANKVEVINPTDPLLGGAGDVVQPQFRLPVQRGEIVVQVEVTMEFEVTMGTSGGWEEWEFPSDLTTSNSTISDSNVMSASANIGYPPPWSTILHVQDAGSVPW